jgi:putative N6-adenine-specific DNA methylase
VVIIDELRIVGSAQTATVMAAEFIRVATRAHIGRPPPPRKEGMGQLVYPFSMPLAKVAVRYLRTATRVLWDCWRSDARRLEDLFDDLCQDIANDRRPVFVDGDTISIEPKRLIDFPAGERQIIGTVKNAMIESARKRRIRLEIDPEGATTRWVVRQDDAGQIVVSRDLGGGSLTQRGWRHQQGEAPLREHLAAVLLMLCRFDPRQDTLLDPMCGSGTIPIEALALARGLARPGLLGMSGLDDGDGEAPPPLFADSSPLAIGCDVDLNVLRMAHDNARLAGVADDVVLQRADFADLTPALVDDIAAERGRKIDRGLIVVNPPYGERLDPGDLRLLYGMMADTLSHFRGWRAGFLVGSPEFEQIFGRAKIKQPLSNGQIRSYFYLYEF